MVFNEVKHAITRVKRFMTKSIEFYIEHLDQFGQGVCRKEEQIYFVPKTLPGESGNAQIVASKKGVHFCEVIEITQKSDLREDSPCPHYERCAGCHYLHSDYSFEIKQKSDQFQRMLEACGFKNRPEVISAEDQFEYRNRIQLHYDKAEGKLGLIDLSKKKILEIPFCLLPTKAIQDELQTLYTDNSWLKKVKASPNTGHIELYHQTSKVKVSINKDYSDGGFTQVNTEQNAKCIELFDGIFEEIITSNSSVRILDLFGGNGNLTQKLTAQNITVVDSGPERTMAHANQQFIQLNLYQKRAVQTLLEYIASVDILVLDPPRSGLKNLDEFVKALSPEYIVYLSCNPSTLIRDIQRITSQYEITKATLLDFFPSTHHWESLLVLKRR